MWWRSTIPVGRRCTRPSHDGWKRFISLSSRHRFVSVELSSRRFLGRVSPALGWWSGLLMFFGFESLWWLCSCLWSYFVSVSLFWHLILDIVFSLSDLQLRPCLGFVPLWCKVPAVLLPLIMIISSSGPFLSVWPFVSFPVSFYCRSFAMRAVLSG